MKGFFEKPRITKKNEIDTTTKQEEYNDHNLGISSYTITGGF